MPQAEPRPVPYADRVAVERAIVEKYPQQKAVASAKPTPQPPMVDTDGEDFGVPPGKALPTRKLPVPPPRVPEDDEEFDE